MMDDKFWITKLLFFLAFLNVLDAIMSYIGVTYFGANELNPLANASMQEGMIIWILFKLCLSVIMMIVGVIAYFSKRTKFDKYICRSLLVLTLFYFGVNVNNIVGTIIVNGGL